MALEIKAAGYVRFSPRRDGNLCESNETQWDYIQAYCRERGYSLRPEPFADAELSGDDENRVGIWNALNALRRGMVLVIYKSDRLARSVYLSELFFQAVRKKGASIEFVTGRGNGDSPEDVFVRQVFAAFAELEKKLIGQRTRAAQLRHQAAGRAMSKIPPFGKQLGEVIVVKDELGRETNRQMLDDVPEELELIERVVWLAKNTPNATLRGIARQMNEEGHNCRGRPWGKNLVERILRRAGVRLTNGKVTRAATPVVSR